MSFPTGEVVASQYIDLGEIEQNWHTPEFDYSFNAAVVYETSLQPENVHAVRAPKGTLSIGRIAFMTDKSVENPQLVQNLGKAVSQIDKLYRDYRGIEDNKVVRHAVDYRVGLLRSQAAALHCLTGNILPFSVPGRAHFDEFMTEDQEAIAVCYRGIATRFFTGPVRKFGKGVLLGRPLARLLVPSSTLVPANHAILFDRNALHQQSPQLHIPRRPGVFLRSIVSVHEEPA